MKTKITRDRNQYIALIIDEPGKKGKERDVLAAMTLFEGTGCWKMTDVRLSRFRVPDPYAGSLNADVLHASLKPENEEDANYIKSRLREYQEDEDGTIRWCTFDGIVRGHPSVKGYAPARYKNFDQSGYFSQAEGLSKLQEIQLFWDNVPDLNYKWRINNPYWQPSQTIIMGEIVMRNMGYDASNSIEHNESGPGIR